MLALVRLEAFAERRPDALSGGQQQRVALARALAPQPEVLLLDEPLSALDLKLRQEMQGELKRLQHETGITFVFVTHDQEEALTMSDRIGVMSAGQLLQVGPPARDLRPARQPLRGGLHRRDELPARRGPRAASIRLASGEAVAAGARLGPGHRRDPARAAPPRPPGERGAFAATVEGATYLGTDSQVRAAPRRRHASSRARVPRCPAATRRRAGHRGRPAHRPGAVQVLED